MDTFEAIMRNDAAIAAGREGKVFDWHKAARLIREIKPATASAGLSGDWEWTGGDIYKDGKPVDQDDTYVYLASSWATPELELDGEPQDCFLPMNEAPDWDSKTYWPDSALAILLGDEAA